MLHFFLKMLICIVQRVILLVGPEELRADSFFHGIPDLDGYEELPTGTQGKELAPEAEIADFAVNLLILNEGPDLPVYHPVELRYQNHIIPILSVLRKEGKPLLPAFSIPLPGVKHQLTLVDYQQQATLTEWMGREVMPGEGDKHCGR